MKRPRNPRRVYHPIRKSILRWMNLPRHRWRELCGDALRWELRRLGQRRQCPSENRAANNSFINVNIKRFLFFIPLRSLSFARWDLFSKISVVFSRWLAKRRSFSPACGWKYRRWWRLIGNAFQGTGSCAPLLSVWLNCTRVWLHLYRSECPIMSSFFFRTWDINL